MLKIAETYFSVSILQEWGFLSIFKKSLDVSNYIIFCRVHTMLNINSVYKSFLFSPLDLMSFNGFCLVVCYLSSVFLKSAVW